MRHDRYSLPLATTSDAAAAAYREAVDLLLSAWPGALDGFDAAIASDPGLAPAQLGRARVLQMNARVAEAKQALADAQAVLRGCTAREAAQVGILARMLEGRGALAAAEAHLRELPRDALVLSPAPGAFGLHAFSGRVE